MSLHEKDEYMAQRFKVRVDSHYQTEKLPPDMTIAGTCASQVNYALCLLEVV